MIAGPFVGFALGIASSLSPCAATRAAVLSALLHESDELKRMLLCSSFVCGLASACVATVLFFGVWRQSVAASSLLYVATAAALGAYGVSMLRSPCGSHDGCRPSRDLPAGGYGWSFVNGAGLGLIGSPCCAPIIAQLAVMTSASVVSVGAIMTAMAFALGHVASLTPLAAGIDRLARGRDRRWALVYAAVCGGVLVSLGGYYAIMA